MIAQSRLGILLRVTLLPVLFWNAPCGSTFAQLVISPSAETARPPWPGQYKLRPSDKDHLTPADVVGPDGIVYPNWTRCGVEGGIPQVDVVTTIEEHGGRADDDQDDSQALRAACAAAGRQGGGAVQLDEGIYYLDRPVTIRDNGVVIRGKGLDATRDCLSLPGGRCRYFLLLASQRFSHRQQYRHRNARRSHQPATHVSPLGQSNARQLGTR